MRLIVASDKDFSNYKEMVKCINELVSKYKRNEEWLEIVGSDIKGASSLSKLYATNNHLPLKIFSKSDYSKEYGNYAYLKRNEEMIKYASSSLFSGYLLVLGKVSSRNVKNLISLAGKYKVKVEIKRV